MTVKVRGKVEWWKQTREDGHRTYTIIWFVESSDYLDGPNQIEAAVAAIADVGSYWAFGNDSDVWALCWPDWITKTVYNKDPCRFWTVEQHFTTRPFNRCMTEIFQDPLVEPPDISGTFVTYVKSTGLDMNGNLILNSSQQLITGSDTERDFARPTVEIKINVDPIDLVTITNAIHTLNDDTLFGLDTRKVKFSRCSWQRVVHGICGYYYILNMGFDIRFDTFDSYIPDIGTRVLAKGGTSSNPTHFNTYVEPSGNHGGQIILDGTGKAWNGVGSPGSRFTQFYNTSNLLLLGIPSSF